MGMSKMSRRRFVEAAALGAGGLVLVPTAHLHGSEGGFLTASIKNVWKLSKEYTLEFLTEMPADRYDFKPTEEVFSFAEQALHLAGGNFWFFSSLKGEKSPKPEDAFKAEGKEKAEVVELVQASFAYGDGFIGGLTEEKALEEVSAGQAQLARWKIILFCVDHITHHRGQMVVYLRLNGIKPPSYRSGYYA